MPSQKKDKSSIDVEIGRLLRVRRQSARLTQEQLGEAVGVTYQQIQKYETGQNRISAGRLWWMAVALNCSPVELLPPEGFIEATAFGALASDAGDRLAEGRA